MSKLTSKTLIAECIVALDAEVTNARTAAQSPSFGIYGHPELDEIVQAHHDNVADRSVHLETELAVLREFHAWMQDADDVTRLLDAAIDHRVHLARRRQTRRASVAVAAALVVGWLLSALVPAVVLARLFGQ